jgi:N-acetylglucosaminyldiphosphoundecaprenol N-acetyl-beta-D-mannosaminyltransferase
MRSTLSSATAISIPVAKTEADDLARNVFGVLGLPIDAIDFASLLRSMEIAAGNASPLLISTPNVNFLVTSQYRSEFRESMLLSNLCLADGMPLIWIAKLLRIPINERIAGSDLFGRLKTRNGNVRRLRVFLLGGADGVGASVCERLNAQNCGIECVGAFNPGFGTIEEMSTEHIIDKINSSRSDLLAVFFGAEKAQAWLMHNHHRLHAPIRAQFGATINFEAGTVKRAPPFLRSTGFEWLWRIKEEPYLWRRYWNDGKVLLRLLVTCVLPLSISARLGRGEHGPLSISLSEDGAHLTLSLSGAAIRMHVNKAIPIFRDALNLQKDITIDVSKTRSVDPRFFGLFLMVRKQLSGQGRELKFAGVTPRIQKIFRLNRFEYLLPKEFC